MDLFKSPAAIDNYTVLSQWAFGQGYTDSPTKFVDEPTLLAVPKWGFLGAIHYWTVARPGINAMSDRRDISGVTRAINGGLNGLQDRTERWNRCLAMGDRIMSLRGEEMAFVPDGQRVVSRSPFRHIGEGAIHTITDLIISMDGMTHFIYTWLKASIGDPDAIALLTEIAGAGGDRARDAALAQLLLDRLAAEGTDVTPPPPPPFVCYINQLGTCAQSGEAGLCSVTDSPVCVVAERNKAQAG